MILYYTLPLLLCFVAALALGVTLEKGFRVRFGMDPTLYGTKFFMELPQTLTDAKDKGWRQTKGNVVHSGYEKLSMWCPQNEYTVCLYFDDIDFVAGAQISVNLDSFSNGVFDWKTNGFKPWSVTENGTTTNYYSLDAFFMIAESLNTDSSNRLAKRNNDRIVQEELFLTGFNGKLFNISTSADIIRQSLFAEQACVPWMGNHYYYNMTDDLSCTADQVFPWIVLEKDGGLIGFVFMLPGNVTTKEGETDYFERPTEEGIKATVPSLPECLDELATKPGIIVMHFYFVENPTLISCP